MKNKILVEVIVPRLDKKYNLFIPANRRIGNIILLINKAITEMSNGLCICNDNAVLYDRETGNVYNKDSLVYDTNIRNGSILVLD